ncbi:MAG: VirB8/TrbF family protein [Desulfocapsaceae bacterium]|nr:VirB8/TrbF family protein [Desulfocapsaceae bacterium]
MKFSEKKSRKDARNKNSGNPYLNAREEWLERYGSYVSLAAQWRLVAFVCLSIAVISISGNVMQIKQKKIVPYIIEVDKLGNAMAVGRADQLSTSPNHLIQSQIIGIINDWRTVTADVELQKKMINRLSYFTTGGARNALKQWYTDNNPYTIAKAGKLVHVDIKGLPLPVSNESYRVEWQETVSSQTGIVLEQQNYEAICTVQITPPESDAILMYNPGGIYIKSISTTKTLGVTK